MIYRPVIVPVFFALVLQQASQGATPAQLRPTAHAALPAEASSLWLVPAETDRAARSAAAYEPLAEGVAAYQSGDFAAALERLSSPSLQGTPLGDYARYYAALSELRLGRAAAARRGLDALAERKPAGYLGVAAAMGAAEAAEADGDAARAIRIYDQLASNKAAVSDEVLSRLGRAALAAGDRKKAAEAFVRVYYEFPLTASATAAGAQLSSLSDQLERTGYKAEIGRAQLLFGARRYSEARSAFDALRGQVSGDDKELVDLRVAECDFYLKRWAAARDGVQPYLHDASRKAEARFFHLSAIRELGDHEGYVTATRTLVADFPDSSWSEEALNNLGTHYILTNQDQLAAEAFRDLYQKFPTGSRAERAAWKYGWWGYKNGDYAETIRVFESAAAAFPRSDYRPSFLYWASRAHGRAGAPAQAEARLRLVYADYGNSYYGRLAQKSLGRRSNAMTSPDHVMPARQQPATPDRAQIPTENTIRLLLASGLHDDALNELRYAQRAWGSSTAIDATIAWAYRQKGELRRAITLMRRAYPQHLTSDGHVVPTEILEVIFPLTYWDSIRRHSAQHGLDPYIIAALIAQESTFDPKIKSVANAWGLMQVVPATGRRLARSVGIRNFTTPMLTDAETNLRLGTLYFARLVKQFGGTHYALASYNAGENRVVRWKAERPGLDEDEFIDDIPFPETQNYVKRILGTAEDYRTLYAERGGTPIPVTRGASRVSEPASPARTAVKKPAAKKPVARKAVAKKPARKTAPKPPVKKRR
jgi:soluble lytic murein transglycosylase